MKTLKFKSKKVTSAALFVILSLVLTASLFACAPYRNGGYGHYDNGPAYGGPPSSIWIRDYDDRHRPHKYYNKDYDERKRSDRGDHNRRQGPDSHDKYRHDNDNNYKGNRGDRDHTRDNNTRGSDGDSRSYRNHTRSDNSQNPFAGNGDRGNRDNRGSGPRNNDHGMGHSTGHDNSAGRSNSAGHDSSGGKDSENSHSRSGDNRDDSFRRSNDSSGPPPSITDFSKQGGFGSRGRR